MRYTIQRSYHPDKLEEYVLELIRHGYEPQGGVAIMAREGSVEYAQALILREEGDE